MKITVEKPVEGREVVSGVIGVNPNNPQYGSIQLSQVTSTISDNGFMNQQKRVAFITGEIDKLEYFVKEKQLTVGCNFCEKTKTDFRLVIEESTEPFYPGQREKINPKTSESLFTADGELIYARTVLTTNPNKQDIRVPHVSTAASTAQVNENVNVLSSVM